MQSFEVILTVSSIITWSVSSQDVTMPVTESSQVHVQHYRFSQFIHVCWVLTDQIVIFNSRQFSFVWSKNPKKHQLKFISFWTEDLNFKISFLPCSSLYFYEINTWYINFVDVRILIHQWCISLSFQPTWIIYARQQY